MLYLSRLFRMKSMGAADLRPYPSVSFEYRWSMHAWSLAFPPFLASLRHLQADKRDILLDSGIKYPFR